MDGFMFIPRHGAILKEEMERSANVLAARLLDASDPNLSSKYFLRQTCSDGTDETNDSLLKHKPLSVLLIPKTWKRTRKRRKYTYRKRGIYIEPMELELFQYKSFFPSPHCCGSC